MNIAYDTFHREFVFRQPRDEEELIAIMSADSEEVFDCYRFDGLDRWTVQSLDAWCSSIDVLSGWLDYTLSHEAEPEIVDGLGAYRSYLQSEQMKSYLTALRLFLVESRSA